MALGGERRVVWHSRRADASVEFARQGERIWRGVSPPSGGASRVRAATQGHAALRAAPRRAALARSRALRAHLEERLLELRLLQRLRLLLPQLRLQAPPRLVVSDTRPKALGRQGPIKNTALRPPAAAPRCLRGGAQLAPQASEGGWADGAHDQRQELVPLHRVLDLLVRQQRDDLEVSARRARGATRPSGIQAQTPTHSA